jgi:hypothetical protein
VSGIRKKQNVLLRDAQSISSDVAAQPTREEKSLAPLRFVLLMMGGGAYARPSPPLDHPVSQFWKQTTIQPVDPAPCN